MKNFLERISPFISLFSKNLIYLIFFLKQKLSKFKFFSVLTENSKGSNLERNEINFFKIFINSLKKKKMRNSKNIFLFLSLSSLIMISLIKQNLIFFIVLSYLGLTLYRHQTNKESEKTKTGNHSKEYLNQNSFKIEGKVIAIGDLHGNCNKLNFPPKKFIYINKFLTFDSI